MIARSRRWLVPTVCVLAACGPDLIWYGHGADRSQRFEIRQAGGAQWLVAGERTSARYEAIATQGFARSAHGTRTAFAAVRRDPAGRERWHVLVDLRAGRAWDAVAALRFDPLGARLAHLGERDGRWHAVVDDVPGPGFDAIEPDSLAFSPDGARLGYVAHDGACRRAVIGEHVGRCVRAVRALSVGATAREDVVIESDAHDPGRSRVLVGGAQVLATSQPVLELVRDPRHTRWAVVLAADATASARARLVDARGTIEEADELGHVVFAPDGSSLAYTLRAGDSWFAVHAREPAGSGAAKADTEQSPAFRSAGYRVIERPVFSADGRSVGFIARRERASEVVLDGRVHVRVATPTATALALSPDGARLAFVHRDAHGPLLVLDRAAHRFDVIVEGTLRFDARGDHWALLVGELERRELNVVVDGAVYLPFDATELFGGGLGEGDAIDLLGGWVGAELARYLERGGRDGTTVPALRQASRTRPPGSALPATPASDPPARL
jgi:hypothetical protein